ncbi:MAG: hypothetical protein J0H83_01385 [Candidatus Melainabacteria bacterium]|jgi:hypothetical protein|nr:hypothetical protein [Candidatus Melainabacteria bacterium]
MQSQAQNQELQPKSEQASQEVQQVVGDMDIESIAMDVLEFAPPAQQDADLMRAGDKAGREQLVQLLEGFVRVLKEDGSIQSCSQLLEANAQLPATIDMDMRQGRAEIAARQLDEKAREVEGLRNLVIEAQDTIIKLLTDRVEDRARIATLETQVNLLPDLQAQADRAMSVAVKTEEYRAELTKVKFELDRFRLHRVRAEAEAKKGTVWTRIQKYVLKQFGLQKPSPVREEQD